MTAAMIEPDIETFDDDIEYRVMVTHGGSARHLVDRWGRSLCGTRCTPRELPGKATCRECRRIRDADWFDWVAVKRAIEGRRVGRELTSAERLAVAEHVISHGGRATAISKLLGLNGSNARELYLEATGVDLHDEVDEVDDLEGAA